MLEHHLMEEELASKQVLDGILLQAYRDRVRLPDGNEATREWIDHPGASAVVPLFEDGSTLLVWQFRYPARRTFLEIPAGKFDEPGEDPVLAAARELEEETGLRAGSFTKLGAFFSCLGYSNELIHIYLAEDLEEGTPHLDDAEFLEMAPMTFDEAIDRIRKGEITDMKTVVGLLCARLYLQQGGRATTGKTP